MREADSAAGNARTAGTVERLVDQGWQGGRWSWQVGRGQPAGQRRKEPEVEGSPQNEHVGRRKKRRKGIRGWRRGDSCGVAGAPVSPWE